MSMTIAIILAAMACWVVLWAAWVIPGDDAPVVSPARQVVEAVRRCING